MAIHNVVLLTVASLLAALGQYFLKIGADNKTALNDFLNYWILLGSCSYILGSVLWVYAMSYLKLSDIYPFTALTFIFVYALAFFALNEQITTNSIIGIFMIVSGLIIMQR